MESLFRPIRHSPYIYHLSRNSHLFSVDFLGSVLYIEDAVMQPLVGPNNFSAVSPSVESNLLYAKAPVRRDYWRRWCRGREIIEAAASENGGEICDRAPTIPHSFLFQRNCRKEFHAVMCISRIFSPPQLCRYVPCRHVLRYIVMPT